MFLKKLLPLLVLIPLLVGNQFQTGSANSSPTLSPKNYLRPLSTITVCASLACDYQLIQDAIDNAAANDTIDLSTQIYVESITIDKDLTIIGDGWENSIIQAAASQGAADARVITVPNGVSVTLDGITIRYGEAIGNGTDAYGGGIFNQGNITIRDCMVTQNISGFGGGIANGIGAGQATAEFINSSIRLNEAIAEGAGIFNEASANGNSSTITITYSTVSENSAQNGGGVANIAGNGAARFSSFNSTISENSVDSNGGGLLNEVTNNGSAIATINQSTFDDNNNGNIYNNNGIVNLSQSIVANSPNGNLDCENIGVDGRVFDDEFNLVEDGTCGFPTGGDPLLGILTLNGGDTQTRALLPGSPALDAIPPAQCASYLDQREFYPSFWRWL